MDFFKNNNRDSKERAFANAALAILDSPGTEPRDESTSNSN